MINVKEPFSFRKRKPRKRKPKQNAHRTIQTGWHLQNTVLTTIIIIIIVVCDELYRQRHGVFHTTIICTSCCCYSLFTCRRWGRNASRFIDLPLDKWFGGRRVQRETPSTERLNTKHEMPCFDAGPFSNVFGVLTPRHRLFWLITLGGANVGKYCNKILLRYTARRGP